MTDPVKPSKDLPSLSSVLLKFAAWPLLLTSMMGMSQGCASHSPHWGRGQGANETYGKQPWGQHDAVGHMCLFCPLRKEK